MQALKQHFAGTGTQDGFPNPFLDVATMSMPQGQRSVLYWAQYIHSIFGTYSTALERVISYFITEVQYEKLSSTEEEKWHEFSDTVGIKKVVQNMLRDRLCYGNSFASIIKPFKRFLSCPQCGASFALSEVLRNNTFRFQWKFPNFTATCPSCKGGRGYSGTWKVDDREVDTEKNLKIKIWPVHDIEIVFDPYTDDTQYVWRIPEDYKQLIRRGTHFHLERVPEGVLKAIEHNQVYLFNPDAIFHMKEPTLSGIQNRGWGLPRMFSNFRQIWYVQVLRRLNEAIAQDYLMPLRVITPDMRRGAGAGGGGAMGGISVDNMWMVDGAEFRNNVIGALRRRRRDPAGFAIMPFPINYQLLATEANQLAPTELINQGYDQLLNDVGIPVDLYKGSLQLQTAPVALRLFESTWQHLVHDCNGFLNWFVRQISQILSWETVKVKMKRVTLADDMQLQMNALQLYMSQQMSGRSAFEFLGKNWKQEQEQIADEALTQAEIQSQTQEKMEQAGFAQQIAKGIPAGGGGGGGGGQATMPSVTGGSPTGDPSTAGAMQTSYAGPVSQYLTAMSGNVPQTPEDMMSTADAIAQDLLGLPEAQRKSELRKLRTSNDMLHKIVNQKLDEKRRNVRTDAGNQAVSALQQPPV